MLPQNSRSLHKQQQKRQQPRQLQVLKQHAAWRQRLDAPATSQPSSRPAIRTQGPVQLPSGCRLWHTRCDCASELARSFN